jgi:hypothetical protein
LEGLNPSRFQTTKNPSNRTFKDVYHHNLAN